MRCANIIARLFTVVLAFAAPIAATSAIPAAASARVEFLTTAHVLSWIDRYRASPEPARVPDAISALSKYGAFKDPDNAGVYVGFIAGVFAANPEKADALIGKMLAIRTEDHWVIVRATAYSGLPDWKNILRRFAARMPDRQLMIEKHLDGTLPRLEQLALDPPPSTMDTLRGYWGSVTGNKKPKKVTLEVTPAALDTLWGYFFATGSYGPMLRIVAMLPWSKDRDNFERLTMGSMAKYTLASNAARDRELLAMLRSMRKAKEQPKETVAVLDEVVLAAETMEISRIRRDAFAALEELKRKGPGYKRDVSWWGTLGQGALAAGCVVAAATGQVQFGLPCVLGGGLSSAALSYWGSQQ